ncbi:TlpA family protein disulfide reductase [Longitalea luteola]|uniref:TlpA family protein disulfide reductase n=1 Tax=Longitalea luteola TaxID=2812563 RepID=UPI001A9626C4|nr:TlpA disulfide reductase family protein [Longitalea luteola]
MKQIFIFVITFFFCSSVFAQQPTIVIKVIGGENKKISYLLPVDGQFFMDHYTEDTLDANGEIVLPNKETVPGAYNIFYRKRHRLFIEPGQQYKLIIDGRNKEKPAIVEAKYAEAQQALENLSWEQHPQTAGMRLYKADSVFANNKQKVKHTMDSCLQLFEQLYAQHKMSKPFYAYVRSCIKNYYAAVLINTFLIPASKVVYHKDSAGYNAAAIRQVSDYWKEVMKLADPLDPVSMSTDTYQDYLYYLNEFYLSYHEYQLRGKQFVKGIDHPDRHYYNLAQYFTKEPLREYVLTWSLRMLLLETRFQEFIPDLYAKFIKEYPNSKFKADLSAGVEEVKQYYAAAKKNFTANQQFVDNYDSISTVEELVSRFKGKTVYIDLWATWCGPCKAQFAFKKDIDPFFKGKGVDVLYVSVDRANAEQKWKEMIKFYDLEGFHLRASEALVKDIYKVFGNGQSISIPRYAICKDGKIVVDKAKRPQDKNELIKQMESVL